MSRLMTECEAKFSDPRSVGVDADDTLCESAYPPVCQSGGDYDIQSFDTPEKKSLSFGM